LRIGNTLITHLLPHQKCWKEECREAKERVSYKSCFVFEAVCIVGKFPWYEFSRRESEKFRLLCYRMTAESGLVASLGYHLLFSLWRDIDIRLLSLR